MLNEFELSYALTNQSSIIKNIDSFNYLSENNSIIDEIKRIKSPKSILQILKLHQSLNDLESKCSVRIAEKYLNGFLESKGVKSFTEFIKELQ